MSEGGTAHPADAAARPAPALDVVVAGLLFEDLVFELTGPPRPGAEVWADGFAESPGGIANFAVALSRLGLRTGLAAVLGADERGDRLRTALTAEGVDLSLSRRVEGWPTPVTVALSYDADRALVTRGTEPPLSADELITSPPAATAVAAHIGPWRNDWLAEARAAGSTVFADVGWDPTGAWDAAVLDQLEHCDVFTPNAGEACTTPGPPHRTTPSSASRTWCPSRSCRSVPDTCSRPASSPRRCGTCRWRGDWPSRTRSPCCR